jgi:uncharacterized protein YjdB
MSMRTLILAVTGFAVSVAACSSSDGSKVFEVSKARVAFVSVSLPPSLTAGQTARGVAVTKDSVGGVLTGRPVSWNTSEPAVASVDGAGMISAVAPGTAIVTAISEGVEGEGTVAVVAPAPAPIATISVAVNPSAVLIGQTSQGTATARDAAGTELVGRSIGWQTSNPNVATVAQTGVVTAVGAGTATISASSEGVTGSAVLSVSAPAPVPVASVSVSPTSASIVVGGANAQLSATTRDGSGNVLTGRAVSWSSANSGIASVNSSTGLVTAVAPGTVVITGSSEGKIGTATITVSAAAPVPVATVSVSGASSVIAGNTVQLSATTRDASGNVLTGRVVSWSSSNAGIASVNSSSGLVTGVAAGTVTITATSETKTGTATITVSAATPAPVATVSVSGPSGVLVGSTVQLSATMRDASGNVLTGRVVTWSSALPLIASVNSNTGLVTGLAVGTVTITATSEGKTGTASLSVAVPPPPGSSNEPTGMGLLKQRAFNSLQEDASWDTDNSLSIIQDASAPKSPSSVIRGTYSAGSSGGSSPGHAGTIHSGARVLYISYYGKLSANFTGHLTGVNKQLYEWANGVSPFYFEFGGVGSGTLTPQVVLQGTPTDGIYHPNLVPNASVTRGQWFHVEIVLTGNTSGTRNGSVDWWLDGVHVGSLSSLQFTSSTTSWDTFEFRPVWGGVGDTVPSTMTLDWDDVYISGKN